MRLKLICCDVFARIACRLLSQSPNTVDVEFVHMLAHNEPEKLRRELEARIRRSEEEGRYDAILLGFGICGNATAGLYSSLPLVIPRAHDCCTVFLGSKEAFLRHFGHALSTQWRTSGYFERCDLEPGGAGDSQYKTSAEYMKLVEQFGEDNADYVWETLHPEPQEKEAVYIRIEGYEPIGAMEAVSKRAREEGKALRVVEGSDGCLKRLIDGEWDPDAFLVVPPGKRIQPTYDMEEVMRAD